MPQTRLQVPREELHEQITSIKCFCCGPEADADESEIEELLKLLMRIRDAASDPNVHRVEIVLL